MDFQQFVTEGPVQYLLCLMAIPAGAAVLLVLYLVISFGRRNKKSKMKLGIPESKAKTPVEAAIAPPPAQSGNVVAAAQELTIPLIEEPSLAERLNFGMLNNQAKAQVHKDGGVTMAQTENIGVDTPQPETETVELLRLLRHQSSGKLIVEVAGQQYNRLADITDKKVGQYILTLAAHLLAFTGGVVITPTGTKSLAVPKVEDVPLPLVSASQQPPKPAKTQPASEPLLVPRPSPEAEAAFRASLQNFQPMQPDPLPSKKPGLFGLGATPAGPSAVLLPSIDLAGEINDIMQRRLRYIPLTTASKVEIRNDVGGGILILVNGQAYHGPAEIPDPEIQKLIRDSIKEWEST